MIMMKNTLFDNMHVAALERLKGRSPEQICRAGNVAFERGAFHFESLGRQIAVRYPEYGICPELDPWHILTILHYLAAADGTPLSGRPISFSDHRDGLARGHNFDRDAERQIQHLGALSAAELKLRCRDMGAQLCPSNADFCAEFHFMPNYPVWLKLWFADDEFPASGRLLLDASAEHYLSMEDAVTVGTLILNRLLAEGRAL